MTSRWPAELLDAARKKGDPVADAVVDQIEADHGTALVGEMLSKLWRNNAIPDFTGSPLAPVIDKYLDDTQALPPWADQHKIRIAEQLFFDHGIMTVLALFCGSLPESYSIGSEAVVMQRSGQLIEHTEHRIRATAAMIFPVMDSGGLGPNGTGVRQIQKVRLIHATIRHLILRGDPKHALGGYAKHMSGMQWDAANGVPINQENLSFTLLTFSYVFLECWRKLGIALDATQRDAFVHCWNVAAHILGVEREVMADSFDEAGDLFGILRARGLAETHDGRELAKALMAVQERHVPIAPLKPVGPLLMRRLISADTANVLGVERHASVLSRALFAVVFALLRAGEWLARLLGSERSPVTYVFEKLARVWLRALLLDQTRPLKLPDRLLDGWRLRHDARTAPA
ncbi:MAG TPA: oxygenase MpaB family protein [Gemmatimonadaceae bacterium]|nr:oxygenase MpaB family protein [Gemmatimonadaceae bacterium]